MSEPAKGGDKPKKEIPWGLPVFILLLLVLAGYGVAIGLPAMGQGIGSFFNAIYSAAPAINWSIGTIMRLIGIALVVAIVIAVIKSGGKKEEHHG